MAGNRGGPELSIVMVSYNAAAHLERTLAALTGPAKPAAAHEVILVDNGSADGAADVAERFLGAKAVTRLGRNSGFGYAVNRGAERSTGDHVLLLNPDAEPKQGAIDALLAHLRANPGHGVVGGRYLAEDGTVDPRSCFGRITLWSLTCGALGLSVVARGSRVFDPEALGHWGRDSARHVDVISGGFLLVSRELWDRLGGFDELFLIYGEDQDLCLRAARLGLRPSMTPTAEVVHAIGASSSTRAGRDVLVLCGRATVVRRHYTGLARRYGLGAMAFGVLLRSVAERVLRRPGRWTEVWRRRGEWVRGWQPGAVLPGERVAA
ncbi:glycosyltransferase family 2 protein [Actinokineospora sp. PR83]|uniref:glycosyltransferase family 2 protein n=1 Tax=Actinokineospora sp. PR83 TaxID=2884908 RepID=UPI0027E0DAA8|nr:glycosyltransferase family 2 protein [Actinokineospora sp. PR83]MCG8915582.1 glycosyltransferase family 2 protein [Actinokineospora sp. PR83]